jgi:hypothetical protein
MPRRNATSRKVLIASMGVAAVSYIACGGDDSTGTGNSGGSSNVAGANIGVGNLMYVPFDAGRGGNGGSGGASAVDAEAPEATTQEDSGSTE